MRTFFIKAKAKTAILKRREVRFCMIAYPALYYIVKWIETVLRPITESHPAGYGFLVFGVCFIVVFCTAIEVVNRLWTYGLQGGKLKIREREGIHIEDHNI